MLVFLAIYLGTMLAHRAKWAGAWVAAWSLCGCRTACVNHVDYCDYRPSPCNLPTWIWRRSRLPRAICLPVLLHPSQTQLVPKVTWTILSHFQASCLLETCTHVHTHKFSVYISFLTSFHFFWVFPATVRPVGMQMSSTCSLSKCLSDPGGVLQSQL